ncbi:MAG: D-hexose-6-phosphate mutarotase [Comamonadaceae bacterium]|nr:MAG: D-hexose-6-phosphate mutarotase [Comamonadaceae bacterium]
MRTITHCNGQPCVDLSLPQGDRVRIALHGAHVLSWTTADGVEQLYLSPKAHIDGRSPIRGGIPVCFPQFNQRVLADTPLPKHGFARTQAWTLDEDGPPDGTEVRLRLASNPETLAMWPHRFDASLTVRLAPGSLRMTFGVSNTGDRPFPFALALHTYMRTTDIARTRLDGLGGVTFWDAVEHLQEPGLRKVQPAGALAFTGETDRVYADAPSPLVVGHPGGGLEVSQSASLTDTVVWNPGAERCAGLDDMPPLGYADMLCVEAAQINQPVMLAPGDAWSGWQALRVLPPAAG